MSCPECFSGHVRDEEPRGTTTQVHGLNTYVSEPANGHTAKGIIVIIPDAFGWEFVNNRLLADHFAEKGDYKVYLPDFFKGMAGTTGPNEDRGVGFRQNSC
jgi:dienelactone hydrolase